MCPSLLATAQLVKPGQTSFTLRLILAEPHPQSGCCGTPAPVCSCPHRPPGRARGCPRGFPGARRGGLKVTARLPRLCSWSCCRNGANGKADADLPQAAGLAPSFPQGMKLFPSQAAFRAAAHLQTSDCSYQPLRENKISPGCKLIMGTKNSASLDREFLLVTEKLEGRCLWCRMSPTNGGTVAPNLTARAAPAGSLHRSIPVHPAW